MGSSLLSGYLKSSINGDIFETWVEQILLAVLPASSVIVMDNAAFHKRESTKALIENAGHKIVWLPVYSSDLNPIEKMWAKVKQIWRSLKIDCIDTLFKVCMQC